MMEGTVKKFKDLTCLSRPIFKNYIKKSDDDLYSVVSLS